MASDCSLLQKPGCLSGLARSQVFFFQQTIKFVAELRHFYWISFDLDLLAQFAPRLQFFVFTILENRFDGRLDCFVVERFQGLRPHASYYMCSIRRDGVI